MLVTYSIIHMSSDYSKVKLEDACGSIKQVLFTQLEIVPFMQTMQSNRKHVPGSNFCQEKV